MPSRIQRELCHGASSKFWRHLSRRNGDISISNRISTAKTASGCGSAEFSGRLPGCEFQIRRTRLAAPMGSIVASVEMTGGPMHVKRVCVCVYAQGARDDHHARDHLHPAQQRQPRRPENDRERDGAVAPV